MTAKNPNLDLEINVYIKFGEILPTEFWHKSRADQSRATTLLQICKTMTGYIANIDLININDI